MRRFIQIFFAIALIGSSYSLTPIQQAQQIRAQNDFKTIEKQLIVIFALPKSNSKESSDKTTRRVVAMSDDGSLTSIIGEVTLDPWGRPYRLKQKDKDIILLSAGPDRKFASSDDLSYNFTLKAEQGAAANP